MFTPPRFVVIDDNRDHLHAIADAIQLLGSVCARVHYQIEEDVPVEPFRSVRAIFIDLQLQDRAATSDFNRHFAEIQRILQLVINPDGGPFLLVVWTDRPEQVDDLTLYLEPSFAEEPHTRPVAIVPLSKTDYIDTSSGTTIGDGSALRTSLLDRLNANPAAASLVQWETEVLDASSRVLADLVGLSSGRDSVPGSLATLLKRLATEAVGQGNLGADHRSAIEAALFPLLQDHLQNGPTAPDTRTTWSRSFEGAPETLPSLSKDQVSRLNTMLHFTTSTDESPIRPTTWGAVSELEQDLSWPEFGQTDSASCMTDLVTKNVRISWPTYQEDALLLQIRIGAACDYAQRADGPVPLALAVLLPERKEHKPHFLNPNSTAWLSPVVNVGRYGAGQLLVDPRFVRVRGAGQLDELVVVGRLKEQLLLELVSAVSAHGSRPGIVRFVEGR